MKSTTKLQASILALSAAIAIAFYAVIILAPSVFWTSNTDWSTGTFTNTTSINGDLQLDPWNNTRLFSDWSYRKQIIVNGSTAEQANYQVPINLTTALYNNTGLVGSWHFTNNDTSDSSGYGNNGVQNGGVNCSVTGKFGGGCGFDGVDDYVQNSSSLTGIPTGSSARTIEAWIKINGLPTSSYDNVIFAYGSEATGQAFILQQQQSDNRLLFQAYADDVNSNSALSTGAWYHVAVTYDGTTLTIYVNGIYDASAAKSYNTVLNSNGFRIGESTLPSYGTRFFNGTIDEVRIYNRSLSAAEISEQYNAGKSRLDYQDLRFTYVNQSSGAEQNISHWLESDNSAWIKIPNVTASTVANTTLYMYYGNPSATYDNSLGGNNTFISFNGLDTFTKSDPTNSLTVTSFQTRLSNSLVSYGQTDSYLGKNISASLSNFAVDFEFKWIDWFYGFHTGFLTLSSVLGSGNPSGDIEFRGYAYQNGLPSLEVTGGSSVQVNTAMISGTKYFLTLQRSNSNVSLNIFTDSLRTSHYTGSPYTITDTVGATNIGNLVIYQSDYNSGYTDASDPLWDLYVSNVRVRKYASPEPSVLSVGVEQTAVSKGTYLSNTTTASATISSITASWNASDTWTRRANVTINNSAANQTNYQVFVNVSYNNAMRSDYGDLRFFWLNGTAQQKIPYWIENYTSSFANVWMKVPSVGNLSNETVYMYYGNPSASYDNSAGGGNTFIAYHGAETVAFFDNSALVNPDNVVFVSKISYSGLHRIGLATGAGMPATNNIHISTGGSNEMWGEAYKDGVFTGATSGTRTGTAPFIYKIIIDSSNAKFYYDSTLITTTAKANLPTVSMGISTYSDGDISYTYVRSYASPEPNASMLSTTTGDYRGLDGQNFTVELTADGSTWLQAANNTQYSSGFGSGSTLRYRINFTTDNTSRTAIVSDINITYTATANTAITCDAGGPYLANSTVIITGNISNSTSTLSSQPVTVQIKNNTIVLNTTVATSDASGNYFAKLFVNTTNASSVFVNSTWLGVSGNCTYSLSVQSQTVIGTNATCSTNSTACAFRNYPISGWVMDSATGSLIQSGTVTATVQETGDSYPASFSGGYFSISPQFCLSPGRAYRFTIAVGGNGKQGFIFTNIVGKG